MPPIKKIVMWLVVIFLLYAIFTAPTEAADMFRLGLETSSSTPCSNVASFFDSLHQRVTWRAGRGWTASSSATSSTARRSSSPCVCTGSTSSARSSWPLAATVFAFWVDTKVPRRLRRQVLHEPQPPVLVGGHPLARLDGAQLAARVVRRHRQALPAVLRLHPPQGRDDAAAQGHRHDLRPIAARVASSATARSCWSRPVRTRRCRSIDHVPDADTHYRAICTQLFGPGSMLRFQPPGPATRRPAAATTTAAAAVAAAAATDGRMPVGRLPRAPGRPSRRHPRCRVTSPISRPESWYRSSNLGGPSRLGDTGEIPVVRVPSRRRATGRCTRRRTGPTRADPPRRVEVIPLGSASTWRSTR